MQNNNILSPLSQFNYIDVHGADSIDGDTLMEELIWESMEDNTSMETAFFLIKEKTLTYMDIELIPYRETLIEEDSYIENYMKKDTIDDYIDDYMHGRKNTWTNA